MKRFHVHVAVEDLTASIKFYSSLFGHSPSTQRVDYAKWMIDDPRLNFAISSRGHASGVNHFGMQVDTAEELASLKALADSASNGTTVDQGETACCYSNSAKHWTVDPQGLAWEHFRTMSDALSFGEDVATESGACCIPLRPSDSAESEEPESCCIPQDSTSGQANCCA